MNRRPATRDKRPARLISPAVVVWLLVLVGVLYAQQSGLLTYQDAVLLASLVGITHSAVVFMSHGGPRISAPGVFAFATGLFAFFPGVYLATRESPALGIPIFAAVQYTLLIQILAYYLHWKPRDRHRCDSAGDQSPASAVMTWGFGFGVFLIAVGYLAERYLGLGATTLAGAAAFAGVAMVSVSVIQSPGRLTIPKLAIGAGAFLLYVSIMFQGGGRLILGVLAMVIAIAVAQKRRDYLTKVATLMVTPIGLLYLASLRADAVASLRGDTETGLESVIAPLPTFARVMHGMAAGDVPLGWGSSFWAALVVPFPRSLWEDKPAGLGLVLTQYLQPETLAVKNTQAIILPGEFYYNFGVLGIVLAVPVIAWFVGWIDRLLVASQETPIEQRRHYLGRVATVLLAAGVMDLVWTGTSNFVGRSGLRMIIVLGIYMAFAWANTRTKSPARRTPESRARRAQLAGR